MEAIARFWQRCPRLTAKEFRDDCPVTPSPLRFAEDALAPTISTNPIRCHYNKHHAAYVETLNELVHGTRYASIKLEEVVRATKG
jgi:superoxide dismutase